MNKQIPEWVIQYIKSPECKKAIKQGLEDSKQGKTIPWLKVKKELDL